MFHPSANRSQGFREFKVKHAVRATAVLAACIWLVYQIKNSGDRLKPAANSGESMEDGASKLYLGRREMVDLDNDAASLSMEIEKPQDGSEPDQWKENLSAKSEIDEGGGEIESFQRDREDAGNDYANDVKAKAGNMEKQFSGNGDQEIEGVQFEQQSNTETTNHELKVTEEDDKDISDKEEAVENETVGHEDQETEENLGQFEQQSNTESPKQELKVTDEDAKDVREKEEAIENVTVGHEDQETEENLGQFELQDSVIVSLEGENEKRMPDVIDTPNKMHDKVERDDTGNVHGEEDAVRESVSGEDTGNVNGEEDAVRESVSGEDTGNVNGEEDAVRESVSGEFSQSSQTENHDTVEQEDTSKPNVEEDDVRENASEQSSQNSQTGNPGRLVQDDRSKLNDEEDDVSESVTGEFSQGSPTENHETVGQEDMNIGNREENDVIESVGEGTSENNQKQDIAVEQSDSRGESHTFYDENGPRDSKHFSLPLNRTESDGTIDILQNQSPVTVDSGLQTDVDSTIASSTSEASEVDQISQIDDANEDGELPLQPTM